MPKMNLSKNRFISYKTTYVYMNGESIAVDAKINGIFSSTGTIIRYVCVNGQKRPIYNKYEYLDKILPLLAVDQKNKTGRILNEDEISQITEIMDEHNARIRYLITPTLDGKETLVNVKSHADAYNANVVRAHVDEVITTMPSAQASSSQHSSATPSSMAMMLPETSTITTADAPSFSTTFRTIANQMSINMLLNPEEPVQADEPSIIHTTQVTTSPVTSLPTHEDKMPAQQVAENAPVSTTSKSKTSHPSIQSLNKRVATINKQLQEQKRQKSDIYTIIKNVEAMIETKPQENAQQSLSPKDMVPEILIQSGTSMAEVLSFMEESSPFYTNLLSDSPNTLFSSPIASSSPDAQLDEDEFTQYLSKQNDGI